MKIKRVANGLTELVEKNSSRKGRIW